MKKFDSLEYTDALANGDICLAVGYSGDSFRARDRAKEAENGNRNRLCHPQGRRSGLTRQSRQFASDAPHVEEAYAFIDFLLRPAIAARNTNFTHLANSVPASKSLIDKTISGNPSIYPDDTVMQRLFAPRKPRPGDAKAIAREWARIKIGK